MSGKSIGSPSCNFWQSETATNYPDPISGYVKNAAVGWGMGFQSTSRASPPTGCNSYDAMWDIYGWYGEGGSQQWGCNNVLNVHLTGGRIYVYVATV